MRQGVSGTCTWRVGIGTSGEGMGDTAEALGPYRLCDGPRQPHLSPLCSSSSDLSVSFLAIRHLYMLISSSNKVLSGWKKGEDSALPCGLLKVELSSQNSAEYTQLSYCYVKVCANLLAPRPQVHRELPGKLSFSKPVVMPGTSHTASSLLHNLLMALSN